MKCNVAECQKEAVRKGMCMKHYMRLRINGTLELKNIHYDFCTIENCNEKHYAKGLCRYHYFKNRHTKKEKIIKICKVEGCNEKHCAFGLCMKHYKQKRRQLGIDK